MQVLSRARAAHDVRLQHLPPVHAPAAVLRRRLRVLPSGAFLRSATVPVSVVRPPRRRQPQSASGTRGKLNQPEVQPSARHACAARAPLRAACAACAPLRAADRWRVAVTPGLSTRTTAYADRATSAWWKTSRPVRNANRASSTQTSLRERAVHVRRTRTSRCLQHCSAYRAPATLEH